MRSRLVIALVIGSMLFLQAPAQAAGSHLYVKMTRRGNTTEVQTNCPARQRLTIRVGNVQKQVTVRGRTFRNSTLNSLATATGTPSATCSNQGTHSNIDDVELPFTGVTTAQQLAVGLGLVGVGVGLLLFAPERSRRRPRRKRPPVRVYAQ